jgi:hypothetical protein
VEDIRQPKEARIVNSLSRRSLQHAGVIAVLALLSAWCVSERSAYAVDQITSVTNVWNERQTRIRSLRLSWSGEEYCSKGLSETLASAGAGWNASAKKTDLNGGPSEASFEIQMSFFLDAKGRQRLDRRGKEWCDEKQGYGPQTTIDIFDGQFRRFFSPESPVPYPCVQITKGGNSGSIILSNVQLLPVIMAYRPLDATLGVFKRQDLLMSGDEGIVDGRNCIVLRQESADSKNTIWVDVARDYLPIRYFTTRRGRITKQVEVSYSKDERFGWVPSSWNILLFDTEGHLWQSFSATKVECEFNQEIPDQAFEVTYPVGTWVNDYPNKETYLLLKNGKKRPILPGEYTGKNYDELLYGKSMSWAEIRRRAIVVTCLVGVVVLGSWLFLRRRRRAIAAQGV